MKRMTWNQSLRALTMTIGVSATLCGSTILGRPSVGVAHAAEAVRAASVDEAAKVLDLRKVGLPSDATLAESAQVNMVNYETKAGLKDAFQFQQQQLVKAGFKEQPGTRTEPTYCNGAYRKDGFTVSLMVYSDPSNPQMATTRVFLSHLGNLAADQVPVIKDAKRVVSGEGHAVYGTNKKAAEAAIATRETLTADGWEIYGSNPIPPESEVQTYKRNAIRLIAYIAPAAPESNQQGTVTINYSLQLMSADIPAPPDAKQVGFADSTKTLHFESEAEASDIVTFYQQRLPKQGFKPTTDEIVEIKDRFERSIAKQAFRNSAGDVLTVEMRQHEGKTTATVTHLTAIEIAAREKALQADAERVVAARKTREENATKAAAKAAKTSKVETPTIEIPDVNETVNAALADALKGTGLEIKVGQEKTAKKTSKPVVPSVKADLAKKMKAKVKIDATDDEGTEKTKVAVPKKELASVAPQKNAGQIVYDDEKTPLTHATAFQMKHSGQTITKVVLTNKPVKQSSLIAYLQKGDADEFLELPSPNVVVQLDERDRPNSMQLQVGTKSLGVSSSDLAGEAVVNDGRARGSFHMQRDGKFFDSHYRAEISFDVALLTKDSIPEKQLANAPKLETSGTLQAAGKSIKLASVVAYETKVFDEKRTAIFFTEKPINLAKLKASLQKDGTDDGSFEFQSQVKVVIDKNDRPTMYHLWSDNASLNSNSNLVGDVTIEGGRARGTVKLTKPAEFFDKEYSFELSFDIDVIPLPKD